MNYTRQTIIKSQFKNYELFFYQKRRYDKIMQKIISRKRIKFIFDELNIKKNALIIIIEKRREKNN